MQNKLNFKGGYIGLLVLLLAIVGGMFFVFRTNTPKDTNEGKNPIEETTGVLDKAKEAKDLLEQTSQKTSDEVEKTDDKKVITNNDNKKVMQATLHTSKGDITIEFGTTTPKTVENFVKLAREGFYDGTKFHRVIKGFMSQGGDPLSKDDSKAGSWGTGGPGYKFDDELTATNKNNKYTIAMANSGPNTNGSQFFINATNNNFLDGKHVVFGHVTVGMDVADAINNVATAPGDRPLEPVVLKSITLK